jgi:protein-S-isoprenylcysteine O-methyltransferase Ste14
MLKIGIIAVVLFLATIVAFFFGFLNPAQFRTAATVGVGFFGLACLILAITIWRRTKTERI